MNELSETPNKVDMRGDWNPGTVELVDCRDLTQEELAFFRGIKGDEMKLERHMPETSGEEFGTLDRHTEGLMACDEQMPNFEDPEMPAIGENAKEPYYPEFWNIGPEPIRSLEVPVVSDAKPDVLESKCCETEVKLENFSNLADLESKLNRIEATHIETKRSNTKSVIQARIAVVLAIKQSNVTRFDLGKALSEYREHFKADRGWMVAARAIAGALGCDERTVRNIIVGFEQAARLPAAVVQAAQAKGIDLAKRRNHRTFTAIESAIANEGGGQNDIDAEEAERIVSNVLMMPSPGQREFIQDDSFVKLTREEKQHFAIRMKVRTALTNVEPDQKMSALIAALEEEMYSIWGKMEPVTVTITPRPSAFTIDGRKKREDAA
jgi:hypothetical protein